MANMYSIECSPLGQSVLEASTARGISATTSDGKPARLAIIDNDGQILDSGSVVADQVWNLTIELYSQILQSSGMIKVHSSPTGLKVV